MSLDLNEARDDAVLGYSGISWTTCKQSAHCSRQITTPTPHHSIFTGRLMPNQQCQSTDVILLSMHFAWECTSDFDQMKKVCNSQGSMATLFRCGG